MKTKVGLNQLEAKNMMVPMFHRIKIEVSSCIESLDLEFNPLSSGETPKNFTGVFISYVRETMISFN